jgi:hypothetical protein
MNTQKQIAILALLAALPVAADESTLRYDLSGRLDLTMEQEIYVADHEEAMATRNFQMTFDLGNSTRQDSDGRNSHDRTVKLSAIKASYSAHGMNQRLPTTHLTGNEFKLMGDGRSYDSPGDDREVPLGAITDGGLRPSELLAAMLPVLPDGPVSVGMKWNTDRSIVSLEGWAWAGGDMRHHHEITDIRLANGHTEVTVKTWGETTISAAHGHTGFLGQGTLSQHFDWRFDADSGQLLSLSAEQAASGTNQLPQGEIPFRQVTRYGLLTNQ